MKIESKIKEFFNRTAKLEKVSWDENVYVPIKKTIQPDKRLSFNDTFIYIYKQLNELRD